ncbi:MotE family protein [Psychrobacillus sp. NPDC096389]|uniref:MotE family protein n=1 Tax=Psychrobacillus sp. NPDC096389 TaxID=3364490 RepID=UPI003812C9EB
MAKQNKSNKSIPQEKNSAKGISKMKMFLYWFIIPLLFALALLLIIAQILDVNVFEKAKELTGAGQTEVVTEEIKTDRLEERVVSLQAEIQQKEAEIDQLQVEIENSAKSNEALLVEQQRLLDEIETLQREQTSTKQAYSEIVSTFEKMSAKAAAPVITKMSDAEALRILTSLKPDTVAKIYEKMTPEDAAKYTELMTEQ